jgi:hypothetical protein
MARKNKKMGVKERKRKTAKADSHHPAIAASLLEFSQAC